MSKTIWLVIVGQEHESSGPVAAYTTEAAANAHCESLVRPTDEAYGEYQYVSAIKLQGE